MKCVLTIAGSDCSGGAGIQADIKTMQANGVYAMSAVTALTAQNTTGVYGIMEVSPGFLEKQMDCIFSDIFPDAIKIGMVSSSALIETITGSLLRWKADNIVVDPVMVSTSGSSLLQEEARTALQEKLLPMATIMTPNIPEAEALTGQRITGEKEMEKAALVLGETYRGAVLIKGGHQISDANDLLCENGMLTWFKGEHIANPNTHGTGCTLSSAIASNLAKGYPVKESIKRAKTYISGALRDGLNLGKGSGPLNHGYAIPELKF